MQVKNKRKRKALTKENLYLLVLTLPFITAIFLFAYLPLYGWRYAFYDYKVGIPLSQTDFIGIEKFLLIFKHSKEIIRVMTNTLSLSFLSLICEPLPAILAIMISEVRSTFYKKSIQTITTLPHFIGWVVIYSIAFLLFSSDGIVNEILLNIGLVENPTRLLQNEDVTWMFQTLLRVWKGIGWGAIIYLAAISGIDTQLYDAAKVDGAGRFRRIMHITVPGLTNTFVVLLLLNIGNLLNAGSGMEQYLVFSNPLVMDKIEVLDLYVYRKGLVTDAYAFATAVGMLKTFVSLVLLFTVNGVSKKIRGNSIF